MIIGQATDADTIYDGSVRGVGRGVDVGSQKKGADEGVPEEKMIERIGVGGRVGQPENQGEKEKAAQESGRDLPGNNLFMNKISAAQQKSDYTRGPDTPGNSSDQNQNSADKIRLHRALAPKSSKPRGISVGFRAAIFPRPSNKGTGS